MHYLTPIVLIVLVVSCNAEKFIKYPTDTVIHLTTQPAGDKDPCVCQRGQCKPREDLEGNVCREVQRYLRKHIQPIPHFHRCQLEATVCTNPKNKAIVIQILMNALQLSQQIFNIGGAKAKFNLTNVGDRQLLDSFKHIQTSPFEISVEEGKMDSVVVFESRLNVKKEEGDKLVQCWGTDCASAVNTICFMSMQQVRSHCPDYGNLLTGCHVSRIYEYYGEYFGTFWHMFDHKQAYQRKLATNPMEIRVNFQAAALLMKVPLLNETVIAGMTVRDYCEYYAESESLYPYSFEMADQSSRVAIGVAMEAKSTLAEQIFMSDPNKHHCLADMTDVSLTNQNNRVKYGVRLLFSLSCLAKHNKVTSCKDYVQTLAADWKKGDAVRHVPKYPTFSFKHLSG